MSFVGGKLKLKGGETIKPAGGVKKKKKAANNATADGSSTLALSAEKQDSPQTKDDGSKQAAEYSEKDIKQITRGYELQEPGENADRRTEAEKRYEEKQKQLEIERLKKLAAKSHRDRVKEFNDYLANLSEHHDIPRVGPG